VLGYDEYREMVLDFSPEKAAQITDVPLVYIKQLAQEIAKGKPVSFCPGFGMQRYTNSGQTMRAMMALLAITGNIGVAGAGWLYANLQSHVFAKISEPLAIFPPAEPDGIARISISTSRLGQDMLAQRDPPLKMIWVERGNPVTQNPETHTVLRAFRSLDFRVVVEQFFTDTAREADIILPAKTMFEQSDVIDAYWHPYIQLKQKIIEPPGEVKPESEVYWLLAKKLGITEKDIVNKIPGPTEEDIETYLEKKLAPFPQLSLEKLKKGPILTPGLQEVAFSDFKFPTLSGKIELLSEEACQRWGLDPLPVYSEPQESIARVSSESKKYPLYLLTPNTKNRTHSQFNNLKLIRQFSSKPLLLMNPDDALAREINSGDWVNVFNDRGALEIEVDIDFSLKEGCISVTNGWWISQGGTVNFLSLGRETDMGHGSAYHDNLVQVEKIK
jgi:anaerobic selenocysteine-containing dehydrogenase